jgi:hypothetical protein
MSVDGAEGRTVGMPSTTGALTVEADRESMVDSLIIVGVVGFRTIATATSRVN